MKKDSWKKTFNLIISFAKKGKTIIRFIEKDLTECHIRFILEKLSNGEILHLEIEGNWKEKIV
ncbi:MAG: hypothetical protein ACOC5T_07180 [Elusimicrobiota bacterium]